MYKKTAKILVIMVILFSAKIITANELLDKAYNDICRSYVEMCVDCKKKLRDKAFSVIASVYFPDEEIAASAENKFVINEECQSNEFMLESMVARPKYVNNTGIKYKGELFYPTVVFKYYSEKNKLVGINKSDWTNKSIDEKFDALKLSKKPFTGKIKLIAFQYGDKESFNFEVKTNRIVVHCKIIEMQ